MNTIVEMVFGSHLYGTNGPSSDVDIKGVFMPSQTEIVLQRVPKSIHQTTKVGTGKNGPDDIESEFYSLHHFLHLACEGETVALDMLHAPNKMIIRSTPIWDDLVTQRAKFYTKNLRAFVGYARRQAAKYGVKGSRLAAAKKVLEFLEKQSARTRIIDVWRELPAGEHIEMANEDSGDWYYEVCGKRMTPNAYCRHYIPMLETFIKNYGDRARQAESNEGVDWKAVSHAFRAGFQVKHILTDGDYTYPLPETPFLIQIKNGSLYFASEVAPKLDALMDTLESLTKESTLPEHVDRAYWDRWLEAVITDRFVR